jgi:hypothetical protein
MDRSESRADQWLHKRYIPYDIVTAMKKSLETEKL